MQVNGLNTQIAGVARQDTRGVVSAPKNTSEEPKVVADFFVTPFLKFDSEAATVLFQIRNGETGDVERQFPAESVVNQYRTDRAAENVAVAEELLQSSRETDEESSEAESRIIGSGTSDESAPEASAESNESGQADARSASGAGEESSSIDLSA